MRDFKDANGNEWRFEITVGVNKRVRKELGVDLFDVGPDGPLMRSFADFELLVDILSVILTPEIQARNMDAESFAAAVQGDALERAVQALQWAVVDFFPQSRKTILEKALTKTDQMMAKRMERGLALMEPGGKIDQLLTDEMDRMDRALDHQLELLNQSGGPSQDMREFSVSPPTHTA